jgi:7-carboxy-7-deazaguanine synthase
MTSRPTSKPRGPRVREIYPAIFGEAAWTGLPGVIVRLTGCNLRCAYCDTTHAYTGGRRLSFSEVRRRVMAFRLDSVLITGGEPLSQPETIPLIEHLLRAGLDIMLETNGALDISPVPVEVHIVMDLKTPGSGQHEAMDYDNLRRLKPGDEIKFVLTDRRDYLWAKRTIEARGIERERPVIFSPAYGLLDPALLARWLIRDRLPVRLGLQIHKYIFGPEARKV